MFTVTDYPNMTHVSVEMPKVNGKQIVMVVTNLGNIYFVPANDWEEMEMNLRPLLKQGEERKEVYLSLHMAISKLTER